MRYVIFGALSLALFACVPNSAVSFQINSDRGANADGNSSIRFEFQNADWQDVIPWFADQAGYSLQTVNEWPEGTFFLQDESEYTTREALDQLNHTLRMRRPPFTLIRNRQMLILARLEDANFPDDLIETVSVSDLDNRGKYETISCVFDMGELNAQEMYEELKPMVNEATNRISVYPRANQIRVRASGSQLRDIRDLIAIANKRYVNDNLQVEVYRLKHIDAESFMMIARGLLDMEQGQDTNFDGSLTISREPFGNRLFLRGTKSMLERFEETASVIDVPADEVEGVEIAKQTFKTYPIEVEPQLGYDLLQTVLEGTGARMQQDATTGAILVLGREEDHLAVVAALDAIAGHSGDDFDIIKVQNGEASEMMLAIQSLLRQTADGTSASGPVVMANSALNQILVRGTPKEVAEVRRMVADLDANAIPRRKGPRTSTRIISMDQSDIEEISPMMEDLLKTTGRKNSMIIVLPDERNELKRRMRGVPSRRPEAGRSSEGQPIQDDELRNKGSHRLNLKSGLALAIQLLGTSPALQTGLLAPPEPRQEEEVGNTSQEDGKPRNPDYRPAEQITSVPGAPIEVRFTDYGIVITSEDLDALDDIELLIQEQLDAESSVQLPTFYFLKHRKADSMKASLEQHFGIKSNSGTGEGGGASLMGNVMNNMLGGGTSDLLGGLLGGGGGGGSAGELEGDVRFGIDIAFNTVYVTGATGNDLTQITDFIETFDQPEPPHNPELLGEFRTIKIYYRDPVEVKDIIQAQINELVKSGQAESANPQKNGDAQQIARMMQQLAGGGKGGGNTNVDIEKDRPKVMLDVDPATNLLLVTGPEFIYKEILKRARELDRPELGVAPQMQMLKRRGNMDTIKSTLMGMYGDKIEFLIEGEGESGAGSNSNSGGGRGGDAPKAGRSNQQQQEQQARAALINAMRSQAAGQRAQGNRQRGGQGGRRDGGGRNGGGRDGGR